MDKGRHLGYSSLIGAKGSSSEKRKKKMTTATDQEAVDICFSFENECTQKELRNIVKKVETFRKNCEYNTVVAFFYSRHEVTVVITFIDTDRHLFDRTRYALGKLIDSHKQPATYGWSLNVNALMTLTEVVA